MSRSTTKAWSATRCCEAMRSTERSRAGVSGSRCSSDPAWQLGRERHEASTPEHPSDRLGQLPSPMPTARRSSPCSPPWLWPAWEIGES